MTVFDLAPNTPATFYSGSGRIAAFRGMDADLGNPPEDWIASTTPQYGQSTIGLTTLPDGRFLRDAIDADPVWWLGSADGKASGVPLVKLLDPGIRIPVHVHPDNGFAAEHLGTCNGKTEAWIVLEAPAEGATVHIGWRESLTEAELAGLVDRQDTNEMFAAMNEFTVFTGDTVFVPAGVPHSIGSGILVLEVQQSADASVLIEWNGYAQGTDTDSFLGLPRSTALGCCSLDATSAEDVESRISRNTFETGHLLVEEASGFFDGRLAGGGEESRAGYAVVVGVQGEGVLRIGGDEVAIKQGCTKLVPHAAGAWELAGDVTIAAFGPCLPPSSSNART